MIKENLLLLRRLHTAADLTLTALAYCISFLILFTIDSNPYGILNSFQDNLHLLILIIPLWLIFLIRSPKAYEYRMKSYPFILMETLKPCLMASGVLIGLLMLSGELSPIRNQIILFIILDILFLQLFRRFIQRMLQHFRMRGNNQKNILIVGTGKQACEFFDLAKANRQWGINVLGFVSENGDRPYNGKSSLVIGKLSNLSYILNRNPVDEVYIGLPMKSFYKVEEVVAQCREQGITAHVATEFSNTPAPYLSSDLFGAPVLSFYSVSRKITPVFCKRVLDIIASGILLTLLSPVFALVAIAIKIDSRGPVFYRWRVVGQNRKAFTGYKFRSMVTNADEIKVKLMDKNEMKGVVFKMKNDPRITLVGRFLRKYSIDELPQLYNVFKGDMSLVGPRPPLQTEVESFANWHRRKLSVKPGITCLWQVSGRNRINNFDDWVKLDLEYIDKWSLWLDFKILARTIPAVFTGKGAS